MNGETNNNKMYAALAVLVIVAIGWYLYSREKPSDVAGDSFIINDPMMLAAGGGAAGDVGVEILDLLAKIQGLKIDASFFADPAYRSLSDYTQQIAPQPVGRDNPFAPIPGAAPQRSANDPSLGARQPAGTR